MEKDKVFAVFSVARQINGDVIFIRPEKAFKKASKADKYYSELHSQLSEEDGSYKPVTINSESGPISCMIELSKFVIEVEADEEGSATQPA